jgi:hypothetical protein
MPATSIMGYDGFFFVLCLGILHNGSGRDFNFQDWRFLTFVIKTSLERGEWFKENTQD